MNKNVRISYKSSKKDGGAARLQESAVMLPGVGRTFNVRTAKANLSALMDMAASGEEVILTSDGKPKAVLAPYKPKRRPFKVNWKHLRSMPVNQGPGATAIVRQQRDARGW